MGVGTITTRANGQTIDASWFNILKTALSGAFVPRDSTGADGDVVADFGSTSERWASAYIQAVKLIREVSANQVTLQSPASLASSYTWTWPGALPGSTLPLYVSAAGVLSHRQVINADVDAAAAIAYGKLALTNSIVNGDIVNNTIAYIKLNLSAGDVPYSKLTLTNSVVNADIASAAAIAKSKLAAYNTTETSSSSNYSSSQTTQTGGGDIVFTTSFAATISKPVAICLVPDGGVTEGNIGVVTSNGNENYYARFSIYRADNGGSAALLFAFNMRAITVATGVGEDRFQLLLPPGCVNFLDTGVVGAVNPAYSLRVFVDSAQTTASVTQCKLRCVEL